VLAIIRLWPSCSEIRNPVRHRRRDRSSLDEQREINEINSAIYAFTLEKAVAALAQVSPTTSIAELYLTTPSRPDAKGETVLAMWLRIRAKFSLQHREQTLPKSTASSVSGSAAR